MTKIVVEIPGAVPYTVSVGESRIASLGEVLADLSATRKALVITDDVVSPKYLPSLRASLEQEGYRLDVITVAAGE